jgi:hypothetical protein
MQLPWCGLVNVSFRYLTLIATVRVAEKLTICGSSMS